jgi:hypothetical protein
MLLFADAGRFCSQGPIEDNGIKGAEIEFGLVVVGRFIRSSQFPGSHFQVAGRMPGKHAITPIPHLIRGIGHSNEGIAFYRAFHANGFIIDRRVQRWIWV